MAIDPLTGAAVVVGGVRGAAGLIGANGRKKRNASRIEEAYQSGYQQLRTRQGDMRQTQLESQIARGIATPGAPAPSQYDAKPGTPIEAAYSGRSGVVKGQGYQPGAGAQPTGRTAVDRHAFTDAGRAGAPNTLAGGAQRELSEEFRYESEDLFRDKLQALADNDGQAMGERVNAIAGGVSAGVSAYQIGSGLKIAGAFGIDPMNPTAALATGYGTTWHGGDPNFAFNVARGS